MKRFLLCLAAPLLHAQATFDVISVKPRVLPPGRLLFRFSGASLQPRGNTYAAQTTTLAWLIMDAYDVKEFQIFGLPKWAQGQPPEYFEVLAKSEQTPTVERLREMLQNLLADRFQVRLHRETRALPIYVLTVGATGHKLRKLGDDEKVPTFASRPPEMPTMIGSFAGFVDLLSRFVDRPLVDRTDLAGNYEHASIDWARFGREMRGAPAEGPSVFSEVEHKLGLKIEPRKEEMTVLVIDSVERSSAN